MSHVGELFSGLYYTALTLCHVVLHDLHLVHTDLKPENILLVHNDYRITTVPGAVTGSRVHTITIDIVL